jgi:hypothetical protein
LPLHQQAEFFQYQGHHTTANLTEDAVEHSQIFQDTGNVQHNINLYPLGTGILNPLALQGSWQMEVTVLVLKVVTISQFYLMHR